MKSKILICLILMMLLFSLESATPGKNRIHSPYDTFIVQDLTTPLAYLKSVCGKDGINRVVILKGNRVLFKGDESETVQNVWSCTKSFTSTVLGLLIAEGKCSLDTRGWQT